MYVGSDDYYPGTDNNKVYALNASTGTLLWSFAAGGRVWSSPAVANGVVYVGGWDAKLLALNASTGAQLWSSTVNTLLLASPAIADGVVYQGTAATFYAFGLPPKSGAAAPEIGPNEN